MLERQGSRIMLEELEAESENAPERQWITAPLERPFGRGINLQIDTDKVDELYARAREAGARIFLPIEEKWYRAGDVELGCRQFIVQDPDGYLLRFLEDVGTRKRA
jgi:hypothetical protein